MEGLRSRGYRWPSGTGEVGGRGCVPNFEEFLGNNVAILSASEDGEWRDVEKKEGRCRAMGEEDAMTVVTFLLIIWFEWLIDYAGLS